MVEKEKIRDFLLAMKRSSVPQGIGQLFMLDTDKDELYACALGKAVIEYNGLDIQNIKNAMYEDGLDSAFSVIDTPGKYKRIPNGRLSTDLEDKWNDWISEEIGASVVGFVVGQNDSGKRPANEIAFEALEKFVENNG
jgi:hypothetical protein